MKPGKITFLIIAHLITILYGKELSYCQKLSDNPICKCQNYLNGLSLSCSSITYSVLKNILTKTKGYFDYLFIMNLAHSTTELTSDLFPSHIQFNSIQIFRSGINKISPNAFTPIRDSLTSLTLKASKLSELPSESFLALSNIKTLNFNGNEIKYIQANSFKNLRLTSLSLTQNQIANISDYAFQNLNETLEEIYLASNFLEIFPLQSLGNLNKLKKLSLAKNRITSIPNNINASLPNLERLDLESNFFTKIEKDWFKIMPNIKSLTLAYNEIQTVSEEAFSNLLNLEYIDFRENKIKHIANNTFRKNINLLDINISYNHLHKINGIFSNHKNLMEVSLLQNFIIEISSDAFNNTIKLENLNIANNSIQSLQPHCFDSLRNLKSLNLNSNFIKKLPKNIFNFNRKLESLGLNDNKLKELDDSLFKNLVSLRNLKLHYNNLNHIKHNLFKTLLEVRMLHLQNNEIKNIDSHTFTALRKMHYIDLRRNHLRTVGDIFPNQNSSLAVIRIEYNRLSLLNNTLRGQTNLKYAYFSENNLKVLTCNLFSDLFNTEILFLDKNGVIHIENKAFIHLKKIKYLDINNNKISYLTNETFYNLVTLEVLLLKTNNIKSVAQNAFIYLIKLHTLDLSENQIFFLNFNMSSLLIKEIRLSHNSISLIDKNTLRTLPDVNGINLKNNSLTWEDITLIKLPELKSLNISNNNFTHISNKTFLHLRSLQSLTMEMSNISQLPSDIFFKNHNLVRVNLAYNNLKDLNKDVFAYATILQELILTGNRFTVFPNQALNRLTSLEVLDLCHNQLYNIEFTYYFAELNNLRTLNVCNNRISVLSFHDVTKAYLKNLMTINLSHNMITVIPPNFLKFSVGLKFIDLSHNFLAHIPSNDMSIMTFPIVSVLNISSNSIEHLLQTYPINQFPLLEELIVTNTNLSIITSKDFENFISLKKLVVSHSFITRISPSAFLKLQKLQILDLSKNKLEIIPTERLKGLYSTRLINISHNTIRELDDFAEDLHNLSILDLSFNYITGIAKDVFKNLPSLTELYLNDNWLSTIVSDIFSKSKVIEHIDLSRNHFEKIPFKMLHSLEMQIKRIAFDDNPMTCDCESQNLWIWMQEHYKIVLQGNKKLRCEYPENLRGYRFLELSSQKLCNVPAVIRIAIQDIQTHSVLVSWQSRDQRGFNGYQVSYFREEMPTIIKGKVLNSTARTTRLNHLTPGTRYVICVIAVGDFGNAFGSSTPIATNPSTHIGNSGASLYGDEHFFYNLRSSMNDSYTSKCTSVSTVEIFNTPLEIPFSIIWMGIVEMLMRRLSLVVGCVGVFVLIVLGSLVRYIKKKKRPVLRRDVVQQPPEYISCDDFTASNLEVESTDVDMNTISH